MSTSPPSTFNVNGIHYKSNQLTPKGRQLLTLLTEAQNELARLETRKALLNAAQQQLIHQLKPLLPQPSSSQPDLGIEEVLGRPSAEIPTTPVEETKEKPAPLPENLPASIEPQHQ